MVGLIADDKDSEKISQVCHLVDLAISLKQERLFVISEQNHLQRLNIEVSKSWYELIRLNWITSQQRICINKLAVTHCDYSPASCCAAITTLDRAEFIEAHKILSYQANVHCVELIKFLKHKPQLLAQCLSMIDQKHQAFLEIVVESVALGVYGCCLLPEDKSSVLELLLHLTHLQLVPAEDPIRLLRHGSCAFARLYSLFHNGLYSGTLFLTAALHSPVMNLLMEDEKFLDIDPDKALIRFSNSERLKQFGPEGSPEFVARSQKYRLWMINKLVSVTNKFIDSIRQNIHCFPSSVCWLVRHIYSLLSNARKLQEKQIFALCVDLVMTSFICPAIVNPESYGIVDAPVSYIGRFNLIQVAKILQTLTMRKYEPLDPKVADLYEHFDEQCLSSIIDALLDLPKSGEVQVAREPNVSDGNIQLKQMTLNEKVFLTEQQLQNLIIALQLSLDNENLQKKDKAKLSELLTVVAADLSPTSMSQMTNGTSASRNGKTSGSTSPSVQVKRQTNLLSKAVNKTKMSAAAVAYALNVNTDDDKKLAESDFMSYTNSNTCSSRDFETVLVFSLEDENETSMIGLLTEQEVLQDEKCGIIENGVCEINVNSCSSQLVSNCSSQDGEIASEAGSNRSEESSIDLEEAVDQNDNLSDMISANVSGRGTPNISGRDTPSSQIMEENDNDGSNAMEQQTPPPPAPQTKHPRFDLDDKFGKFEIKNFPLTGDETVSLVSDTWSTDVLASDSENIDPNISTASNISALTSSDALAIFQNANFPQLIDISETASEGWSTDVVVSDSDRVTDTDDTASVARSDVTTRSEIESRGESVDINADDMANNSATSPSYKDGNCNFIHVIDTVDHFEEATTQDDNQPRPNLINSLSQCSTNSQSRSSSSHQASSVDSEDIRPTSADITNFSTSSAASASSSCSSAGAGEIENPTSKHFPFTDLPTSSATSSATTAASTPLSTTVCTSSSTNTVMSVMGNGNAIFPGSDKIRASPIVKSISFDKTAEKGDKDDDRKQRTGFFKNFKLAFKNRRGRENTTQWNDSTSGLLASQYNDDVKMLQEINSKNKLNRSDSYSKRGSYSKDTSDDILAKYRAKPVNTNDDDKDGPSESDVAVVNDSVAEPWLDICSDSFVFENAKKKLRFVLSNAEIQQLPFTDDNFKHLKEIWCKEQNVLVSFLQLQLAEAINLKDRSLVAHLHETVRCVRSFDEQKCHRLFDILKKEYKARAPYLSYLMRCRQSLLSISAHLNRLTKRIKSEQDVSKNFFASLCVRLFLQKREQLLLQFATEFHGLKLADEKNDLLRNFLTILGQYVDSDPTWTGLSDEQLESVKLEIERSVISRVYMYAMFPNGDGDISRDEVLHDHIKKLSKVITPNHKDLGIPKKYHYECPWPAAQEELIMISAYKTPAEKLGCVLRCTQTIQNLLCLACNNSMPSADSLVPVLVYVIIMANPPSLLSTIQYINSFYSTRLRGEEQYWWVQFCSAVEYIKTMDYTS